MSSPRQSEHRVEYRRAVERAVLAPSVHNTQPWLFTLSNDGLSLSADSSRQLHALDPTLRQLTISCGCALFNARVSLAAEGFATEVDRIADPQTPDLLATMRIAGPAGHPAHDIARLDAVIAARRTNRRQFDDVAVPEELLERLEDAASAEGANLFVVRNDDHRLAVAELSQRADDLQNVSRAYRAELREWTTDDPRRPDGVQAMAVPHVDTDPEDDVPIRDFDTTGMGWLPEHTQSSRNQCLAFITTAGDGPPDWLRAGEALERVLLELTEDDFVASPLTQITEVPATRAEVQARLGMSSYPHVLLRIGRAPATLGSARRQLDDVLTELW